MEQQNKYFTPDISDIRIGYECELNQDDKWFLILFTGYELREFLNDYKKNQLRVPFLTKEQIEAEGWIREDPKYDDKNYKYPEVGLIFKKENMYISFYPNLNQIEIHNNESFSDRETLFNGECKDINTFRFIVKLLGI